MKLIKYLLVGGFSSLVDLSIFSFFSILLEFNYLVVGFFSFIAATLLNYLLSIMHVFESGVRFSKRNEIIVVMFVSGIGLLINQVILYYAVEILVIAKFFAKILASGSVFFWNYSIRSFYIFKSGSNQDTSL